MYSVIGQFWLVALFNSNALSPYMHQPGKITEWMFLQTSELRKAKRWNEETKNELSLANKELVAVSIA